MIIVACVGMAHAQDDTKMREIYTQAENDFQIGRIEQARNTLLQHLKSFQGNERQNALRLIALSYLEEFDTEQTEKYATLMLQDNPYYTVSPQDPLEFADIINNIKNGMVVTVTTASNMSESLDEVPVPTTLITEEMIRDCGGRNLQEVLAAYVPGMHIIDCNDDINIALRGIFSATQEKILIMLNGHRLNSHLTNTAAPDFSISLEKVKQIEVLRGPASSLYGGVALTGVVNIITKQGSEVDGVEIKGGIGNYGQLRGDFVIGKRYFDLDVLAWASVYASRGENRTVSEEHRGYTNQGDTIYDARIGRVGKLPNYDLGFQLNMKGWRLLYDTHFSQIVAPYTLNTMSATYNRDRYREYNGIKPSFATSSHHAELSYSHQAGPLNLTYAATFDKGDITRYQVISESAQPGLSFLWNKGAGDLAKYDGLSRYFNGQEQNYGLQFKGGYNYTLGTTHKGTLMLGAEYSHLHFYGMHSHFGYDYDYETSDIPEMRDWSLGHENSANVAFQLKHQWRSLILNAGVRYDHKHRIDNTYVNEWSPRIALILLRPTWNAKLSYSKAFVDFPYIYPVEDMLWHILYGFNSKYSNSLQPERMHSWQLSVAGNNRARSLNVEANFFYNRASDLIVSYLYNYYTNDSYNHAIGLELKGSYHHPRFTADLNLTWTHTLKSQLLHDVIEEDDPASGANKNNNTPAIVANGVLTWKVMPRLRLHTHILFESRQNSYFYDSRNFVMMYNYVVKAEEAEAAGDMETLEKCVRMIDELGSHLNQNIEMPARCIVNLGGEYTLGPVTIGLNIHNLLNTHYERSGFNTNLVPQQGRWFLATVGVKI
jgi:iron complex outermembrane receptor protein